MAGVLHTYKFYNFTDKDPIIGELHTLYNDEGYSFKDLAIEGNVSETTMRNWFYGKTRRPQNPSIEAFLRSMGYKRKIVKMRPEENATKILKSVKAFKLPAHKRKANQPLHARTRIRRVSASTIY